MYFEEKMIDGVMCFRTTPDGEWRPFDIKELSRRYAAALSDDGWTYCDDRPPEEQGWYIVSIQWADNEGINRRVRMDEFLKGVGFTKFSRHEIIAWRPLPEPAKGRDV